MLYMDRILQLVRMDVMRIKLLGRYDLLSLCDASMCIDRCMYRE